MLQLIKVKTQSIPNDIKIFTMINRFKTDCSLSLPPTSLPSIPHSLSLPPSLPPSLSLSLSSTHIHTYIHIHKHTQTQQTHTPTLLHTPTSNEHTHRHTSAHTYTAHSLWPGNIALDLFGKNSCISAKQNIRPYHSMYN